MESVLPVLQWLEGSALAVTITESDWVFPAIETVHVLALALVIGTVCVVDLRLLGWASPKWPYRQLVRETLPWTWAAFGFSVATGSLMFITQAVEYYQNTAFRIKMLLIMLAGINMVAFELITAREAAKWDHGMPVPPAAKLAATLSLMFWVSIVFFGRRIGFTMIPE